jgi:hypothetical protein
LVAPEAAIVTIPEWLPTESPLMLAPTENDPLLVPEAAAPPFIVSQGVDDAAVQLSVPEPLLLTVAVWLDGFTPFWMAENDMEAGLRPMTGVEDVVVETVGEVGVSNWVRPGILFDSFCIPRPPVELPPLLDEPEAATPDSADRPDDEDCVGLDKAPTAESDVVVVVEVFAGATVLVVVEFSDVESFF